MSPPETGSQAPCLSRVRSGVRCRSFSPLLLHELPYGSNMTGRAGFRPGLEALGGSFQVREEVLVCKRLAKLRDHRLEQLPHAEKFPARLKEKVFVKKAVVEQRAGLFPIADHHSHESAGFCSRRGDAHDVVDCFYDVVLLEPISCLAEPGLAAQIVDLQM